ncbi:MAG: TetR/AcrR family transcriptional regulator [Spirochaetales bacterium]|nr:TetR/AcrR family transcriptional regulator [Spirochaetales bacterium]
MPPKVQFSKEQILNAAFDLVINKGIDALSVRVLAKELGCSVAPIYINFKNTKELFNAVMGKVGEVVWKYSTKNYTKHGFFNIGIGQLLIAKDYPILFKDLVIKCPEAINMDKTTWNKMVDIMESDEMLKGLNREQCSTILNKMALQTSGLSVALANKNSGITIEDAFLIMEETASQLIYAEQHNFKAFDSGKITIDLNL